MKKHYKQLLFGMFSCAICFIASVPLAAQVVPYQIVVANGGDFANPNDFVTVGAYHIDSNQYSIIDTIFTQSVQDVHTYSKDNETVAYVAAQDSIVMYDMLTGERQAEVAMSGVQTIERVSVKGTDYLLVSKGFGADSIYFEILDAYTLLQTTLFKEIDDECSGITVYKDSAYVAMPGNWMSTVGTIHVIDLTNLKYARKIELDSAGAGIYDLFVHENKLYSLNALGWGSTIGILSSFDFSSGVLTHDTIQGGLNAYAEATMTKQGTLLFSLNGKLAHFDLSSGQMVDSSLVDLNYSALAYTDDNIFLTNASFSMNAQFYIHSNTGAIQDSLQVGISAEAMDVEYRESTVGISDINTNQMKVFPNPCSDQLFVQGLDGIQAMSLFNMAGVEVVQQNVVNAFHVLGVSSLDKGAYVLILRGDNEIIHQKIIIQ